MTQGKNLKVILTGKSYLEYVDAIYKLQEKGLALKSKYYTDSFLNNNNFSKDLDFILSSLK